jgi:succinylglutamate desuccinylase
MNRVLIEYGNLEKGKLLIVLAGIHGNEKAGIKALEQLSAFFESLNIPFDGKIIGLAGNLKALETESRFLHKDLNRQWYATKVKKLHLLPYGMLNTHEDVEQKQLFTTIESILKQVKNPFDVFMVDLHTTSAKGGCFTITNGIEESLNQARKIPVPTINGMTKILKGTTIEYFENLGIPAIAFEAGQHEEEASVDRMKSAICSLLVNMGIMNESYMAHFEKETKEMIDFNNSLPEAVEVTYHHPIEEEDLFVMKPGYVNFQPVKAGEELATDKRGPILSPSDSLILMPLYQKKGSDGFFLVKEI